MENPKLFLILLLAIFSGRLLAMNQGLFFHEQSLLRQGNSQKSYALKLRADGTFRTQETKFFDQKLDHTDPTNRTTFKQRYFIDSQYADGAAAPVFYVICGEWNCSGTGSYGFVENLAKKFKAHLVSLEHRYYGESSPFKNLTTKNLSYLNLSAAIEDLAAFQTFMMEQKDFKGKWIAFGGSYAGSLAAFYRYKHPDLVIGALASSGPVNMKPDFIEYDAHVAKVINQTSCGDKVREAVALIENKMKTPEGLDEVKAIFKASDIKDAGDFIYVVADMLAAAVQYGRHTVFCSTLENGQDLIADYAKAGVSILAALGTSPLDISMQSAEKVENGPDSYFRQWMWQSCLEFGWFQVANNHATETSRSSQIDLNYHARVCERLYQVPMTADGSLNERWYFPLFTPSTSKIIFTNGSNDPWQTLSVIPDGEFSNPGFDVFMMNGAAHCNDLKAIVMMTSVIETQGKIEGTISNWLK